MHFSRGVSLIEIAIVVTILPLIITAFILVLDKTMNDAHKLAKQAAYDSSNTLAMERLEHDIKLATGFGSTVSSPFSDPYQPVGGWDYAGSGTSDRVLILSVPATTVRENATTRTTVYKDSASFNCSTELAYNPIHTYRAIYFVDNSTLYKRFLTDTATATCNTQIQKQSCPVADIASWPGICQARDEVIATEVSGFSITYRQDNAGGALPDQYSDSSAPGLARSVTITLTLSDPSSSAPASSTMNQTISRVN